jgi:hypothetical protein
MFHSKLSRVLMVTVLAALGLAAAGVADHSKKHNKQEFQDDMRRLWEDHVSWTRLYIVSAVAGLPDKQATAERLLRNQSDLGDAIKPFYGDEAGAKLTALLRDHILIAAELIDAAKAGDKAKSDDATRRWGANADEISTFLNGANPKHWPLADVKKMMREHLDLTAAEVVAQIQGDWAGSIAAYDRARAQMLHMADTLSTGILEQHPDKFRV